MAIVLCRIDDRLIHGQVVIGWGRALSIDLIILVDVYHEFSEPQKMLRSMREALKPDGRLVLLEYRGEDPAVPIRPEHKMTVSQVKAELEPEGFRLDKLIDGLPRQHILVFRKAR